jgi:hypothetical protein
MDDYLAQFKKMLDCRNLSPHTRDQYASTITQFLDYFDSKRNNGRTMTRINLFCRMRLGNY